MFRLKSQTWILYFGLTIFCATTCMAAAHGGLKRKKRARASDPANVPPVDWSASIDEAGREAKKNDCPFLVYFCSEDVAPFTGAGTKAVQKYSKTVTKMPPYTVFEEASVVDTLDALECPIVKVVASPQTAEIARKYKVAGAPSLVACEPDGTVLCGLYGALSQANALTLLKGLNETYAKWKKANTEKAASATSSEVAGPEPKNTASQLPDDAP